jgi:hypothetical protein
VARHRRLEGQVESLVVFDDAALSDSGITGIGTYPFDPTWVSKVSTGGLPRGVASRWNDYRIPVACIGSRRPSI